MFFYFKAAALSFAVLPLGCTSAFAQTPPPSKAPEMVSAQRPDPANAKAVTPALVYQSSLGQYQPFTEPDVAPWRETNQIVRERGGWKVYAREAPQPASTVTPTTAGSSASPPAANAKPAMPGHAGHQMK